MKAETAYNVILALPEREIPRLYKMLGVEVKIKPEPKRKPLMTDAEATEYLIKNFNRRHAHNRNSLKNINKKHKTA